MMIFPTNISQSSPAYAPACRLCSRTYLGLRSDPMYADEGRVGRPRYAASIGISLDIIFWMTRRGDSQLTQSGFHDCTLRWPGSPDAATNFSSVATTALDVFGLAQHSLNKSLSPKEQVMNFATLLKLPSAYVPVAMSMAALTVVLGAVAMLSPGGESDEGAAAHTLPVTSGRTGAHRRLFCAALDAPQFQTRSTGGPASDRRGTDGSHTGLRVPPLRLRAPFVATCDVPSPRRIH